MLRVLSQEDGYTCMLVAAAHVAHPYMYCRMLLCMHAWVRAYEHACIMCAAGAKPEHELWHM